MEKILKVKLKFRGSKSGRPTDNLLWSSGRPMAILGVRMPGLPHNLHADRNITLTATVDKLKWTKPVGKYLYSLHWQQNFLIICAPMRYKISPYYHWISKLSQNWLLKVKNGMKSDNKDLISTDHSILFSTHWRIFNFTFTHRWL